MGVNLEGLDGVRKAYKEYPDKFKQDIRKELFRFGNMMVKHARKDHEWKRKGGKLHDSITKSVSTKDIRLSFFMKDDMTTVRTKGGKTYSYGVILHEGSGKGYRQSKSARRFTPRTPKKGYGHLADHFMDRAWDKYEKRMMIVLRGTLKKVAKKLGMA